MKSQVLTYLFFVLLNQLTAQQTLDDKQFYSIVLQNHPMAKQANLEIQFGNQTVLKAKGGFDPKFHYLLNEKNYQSSNYYSFMQGGLKIPTWYGIEFKTGFDSNRGDYLNPEEKTPNGGLWYGGISLNLGQGLAIDQRRAELFKAKLYQQSTFYEQNLQLNELIYDAGYSYWSWFGAYHASEVMKDSYIVAEDRLSAVRKVVSLGDRSSIDTIEAAIQVQSRLAQLTNYQANFRNNGIQLANYLWNEHLEPLELDSLIFPTELDNFTEVKSNLFNNSEIDTFLNTHPYLKIIDLKIENLEVERRFKQEMLKPQLSLQYNLLNEPINYNPWQTVSINNYKWGVGFEIPLFLRKERGDLQLAKLKIQDEKLSLTNKRLLLKNKILVAQINLENASKQIKISRKTVADSRTLLEAERQLFDAGESSLFMINSREMAYYQSKLKLVEDIVKYQHAILSLNFSLAKLVQLKS